MSTESEYLNQGLTPKLMLFPLIKEWGNPPGSDYFEPHVIRSLELRTMGHVPGLKWLVE